MSISEWKEYFGRKFETLSRAKPQRPQRRQKKWILVVILQDVQAFLCALCGFAQK
jgi:hypothetical protein